LTTPAQGRPITADDLFRLHIVSDPQPSPDGGRVAYVVTRLDEAADDYRAAIWVVPSDGGPSLQLTSGAARDTTPRWSPDGTRLAFVSNRPSTLKPRASNEDNGDGNGAAAVNASAKAPKPSKEDADDKPKPQIWIINTTGGEARQLTSQPYGASAPAWSADGRTIAFLSEAEPGDAEAPEAPIADERIVTRIRYRFDGKGFL
jgi:Tol biopolymer transport system component